MASVKISQLPVGGNIVSNDEFPVSRGGLETYRILANQIVTGGGNVGGAAGLYQTSDTVVGSTTLRFRSLSAVGEGIQITQAANTVNISISGQNPSKNVFTGTGSQVNFALTNASSRNVNNYRVDIDGVLQEPGQTADYYLDSSNLVFTTPPPSGSKVVVVSNNLLPLVEAVPANNSITNAMFTDECINTPELSSGAVTTDKIALSAVTTQKIANSAITAEKMSGGQTGSAPVYGCRAWVNFSGTLSAGGVNGAVDGQPLFIRAAGNVSRVIKNGTGDYTVIFTTFMPDAFYSAQVTNQTTFHSTHAFTTTSGISDQADSVTLSSVRVRHYAAGDVTGYSGAVNDSSIMAVAIFR